MIRRKKVFSDQRIPKKEVVVPSSCFEKGNTITKRKVVMKWEFFSLPGSVRALYTGCLRNSKIS